MHRLLHLRLTGPRHAAPLLIVVVLVGMFLTSCAENGRTAMTDRVVDGATADSPNLVGDSAGGQAAESAVEEPGTIVQEGATVIAQGPGPVGSPEGVLPTSTVPPTVAPPPAPLAATVNGEYVFLDEYERQVAHYEAALLEQGLDPEAEDGQADLARVREEILEGLIDQVLIKQGAEALGVVVTDEELEAQIETDIAGGQGQAAFDQWLQVTGLNRDEYRRMVGEALLTQRLLERAAAELPAEMEQVHIRSIVVDSESAAQEIQELVAQGTDFGELAEERSQDPATVAPGGDMGWFPRGLLDPAMERVAFDLAAGELDVLRLGADYHIVQVLEKEAARPLSPEARIQLALASFDQWLDDIRQAAVIERFVGE